MRFVHTSDWHLGRTFGGQSLYAEQEAFIAWLVELVRAEDASLVVIAGDVYDRSIPAAESVALFGWALRSLRAAGAEVVVIAGNHDSAERLGAYDDLTDLAGVYIRGGYGRAGEVLHLAAPDGPLDVVPVPFLEPALAPADPGAVDPDAADADMGHPDAGLAPPARPTHRAVVQRALDVARASRRARRSIAIAHAFVAGATSSESERTLSVGGSALVPAAVFDGFSYVALGHLHKPQAFTETVRYSGSPLAYSFSEHHPKQVLVADLDPAGVASVRAVVVDPGRRVATVRGTLDEVLTDPRHAAAEGCWVRAVLTDPTYVLEAKARLQRRFPHVVEVVLDPVRAATDPAGPPARRGAGAHSPLHNAVAFWQEITGEAASRDVVELLAAALDDARLELGQTARGGTSAIGSIDEVVAPADGDGDADAPERRRVPHPDVAADDAGHGRSATRPVSRRRRPAADAPTLFDDLWGNAS